MKKIILFVTVTILCFSCNGCNFIAMRENNTTFPSFEPINVTDDTYLLYNNQNFQMYAFDVSADQMIRVYDVGYEKTFVYNFVYVPSQKKAYFMFWGSENVLMEFDPATGRSRRIGSQSYVNVGAVFLESIDDEGLMIQDNYGRWDEHAGALYRYEYATDTVTEWEYKYLYTKKFRIYDCSDDFITYSASFEINSEIPEYLYNWTKQEDTGVDYKLSLPKNNSGIIYIYEDNYLGIVEKSDDIYNTYLYKIESYIPFKISDVYDVIENGWFDSAYHFGDYIIFIEDCRDIVKYDINNKQTVDTFRTHCSENDFFGPFFRVYNIHNGALYSTNHRQKDAVFKISLDDFSVTEIR